MLKDPLQKKELYPNPDFPFVIFHITSKNCLPPGPGYQYLHWHEDLQFTIVQKGSLSIQVNGKPYTISEGDGIFINCGLLHIFDHMSTDGEYISFNFPSKLLSYSYGTRLELDYVLPFTNNYSFPISILSKSIPWQKTILQYLFDLDGFWSSNNIYGKDYEAVLRLTEVWLLFIRNIKDCIPTFSHTDLVKHQNLQKMLTYIHTNYMHDISLANIAQIAHISTGECCRCFKSILHITPYEYLLTIRISKSRDLLKETNESITKIAGTVGFNSCSHFIQMFKARMKMTPYEYRKYTV